MTALNTLHGADGSATYSSNGYTIVAAVNGPIEVSRRDEQAEQATLEVIVRPAVGVGSPRDRYLELLLHATFNRIIATETFPRSLLQLTLQVLSAPDTNAAAASATLPLPTALAQSSLLLLPALLNAAQLALLAGAVPLHTTLTVVSALTLRGRRAPVLLSGRERAGKLDAVAGQSVQALHVLAVTGEGALALTESEGRFGIGQWEAVCEAVANASEADLDKEAMEVDQTIVEAPVKGRQWLLDVIKRKTGDAS